MRFLVQSDDNFETELREILDAQRDETNDVSRVVAEIISDVKSRGDQAVIDYSARFDHISLTPESLFYRDDEIDAAIAGISDADKDAISLAAKRIHDFHLHQKPQDFEFTDEIGARLGWRWTPVRAAGLYVPGGLASYPSSVLMNAIPAKVAGVKRLVMTVPCPHGEVNPLVLYAAKTAGVDKILKLGGAQAVAALAYGTKSIAAVDKITGPGNAFVAEAKRQVFGKVGIDMIAGPSEVLVIADEFNDPDWIAVDLMSQAEHDEAAQAILITDNLAFAQAVEAAVAARLETLERRAIAGTSWEHHGVIIVANSLSEAAHLSNRFAPEHLQICTENARTLSEFTTEAGAIFLGNQTPEAIGDYIGGPNHVLPTSGTARFASGLGVLDFMKRTTISEMSVEALDIIGPAAVRLATSERLEAHGLSVSLRLQNRKGIGS